MADAICKVVHTFHTIVQYYFTQHRVEHVPCIVELMNSYIHSEHHLQQYRYKGLLLVN